MTDENKYIDDVFLVPMALQAYDEKVKKLIGESRCESEALATRTRAVHGSQRNAELKSREVRHKQQYKPNFKTVTTMASKLAAAACDIDTI
jgi:hypothetical protein